MNNGRAKFASDGHASLYSRTLPGLPIGRMSHPTRPEIPVALQNRVTQRGIPVPKRGDAPLPPARAPRKASVILGTPTTYSCKDVQEELVVLRR
jgi:hypothetical protein